MGSRWRSSAILLIGVIAGCSAPPPGPGEPPVVPVRSEVVAPQEFQASLNLLGVVRPSETFRLIVASGGTIRYPASFARGLRTGQRVQPGEELVYVENESVRLALAEAQLKAESAAADLERIKTGFDAGILPQTDLARIEVEERLARERLESARYDAERLTLRAPRGGTLIVDQAFAAGTEVAPGTVIAEIAIAGPPVIESFAAAADRDRLAPGLVIHVLSPEGPIGEGRIRDVAPVVDAAGTVRVISDVDPAPDLPPPGEGVEIQVQLALRDHVLSVPERALVVSGQGRSVFRLERWGRSYKVVRVPVTIGNRSGDRVEILAGLEEGDRVAVAGLSLLDDGGFAAETTPSPGAEGSAITDLETEPEAAEGVAPEADGKSP